VKTPEPLVTAPSAYSKGGWEGATNTGSERTAYAMLTRCMYQTLGGFRFSTTSRGLCAFSVEVNPETGKVKTPEPLVTAPSAYSKGGWEGATNTGSERTADAMLTRCTYQTLGGFRFSTTSRGLCAFSVEVNPDTGKVENAEPLELGPPRIS